MTEEPAERASLPGEGAVPPAIAAFLDAHGTDLVHNLGHDCWVAAQELCARLAEQGALPPGVTATGTFRVVLSMRATVELMALEHRFGRAVHDRVLATMTDYYGRTLLERGSFASWIAAAHESMRRTENPRAWMRIHAMNVLGTRDPEAETFHLALGYAWHAGASLVTVLEANVTGS